MMKITGTRLLSCHKQLENCYESLDENQYRTSEKKNKESEPYHPSDFLPGGIFGAAFGQEKLEKIMVSVS